MLQNAEIICDDVRPARLIAVAEGLLGNVLAVEIHQELLGLLRDTLGDDSLPVDPCAIHLDEDRSIPCLLRFTRFDGRYEVVVQFRLDPMDLESVSLARTLHRRSIETAARNGVSKYFGGLEPATDEGLRFFTGATPGPLLLDDDEQELPLRQPTEQQSLADRRKGFFRRG